MSKEIEQNRKLKNKEIPQYGLLYFDHLQGEYVIESDSMSETDRKICIDIKRKRDENTLNWDDIYAFQLVLLKYQDFETLKSKIISLRIKYQNLVDTAEYNGYMALRASDLTKTLSSEDIDKLQADCKYLLDEFYLRYAYVSTREDLRTKLLRRGAILTLSFFVLAAVFAVLAFQAIISANTSERLATYSQFMTTFSTLIVVVFAGIMGAFVSMQQRLQNVSNQGDPIFNLSLLTHGWLSIFLSPITGAIFAVILYLFFAGQLLSGTIFPKMFTPPKPETLQFTAQVTEENGSSDSTSDDANPPMIKIDRASGLADFLPQTGPETGKDFALLAIWAFIAGFAERLVPDTLMRLVNQKKPSDSVTT